MVLYIGRIPKSIRKIVDTDAKLIPLAHIHKSFNFLAWHKHLNRT